MERYPNDEYEEVCEEHIPHDNKELNDLFFAQHYAQSLKAHNIELTERLKRQWIHEGFLSAYEISLIEQALEEYNGQE